MATTLLANTNLLLGQTTVDINVPDTEESVGLRINATELVADSVARLSVLDNENRVKATVLVEGSGTKELTVDKVDGALTATISCISGSCRVNLERLSGAEKLGEGTGSIGSDDLAAGVIPNEHVALITMLVDQFGNVAVGNHVELDQIDAASKGNITVSSGGLQASGTITLPADRSFLLQGYLQGIFTAGNGKLSATWRVFAGALIGKRGSGFGPASTEIDSSQPVVTALLNTGPSVANVRLEITRSTALVSIRSTETYVLIREV